MRSKPVLLTIVAAASIAVLAALSITAFAATMPTDDVTTLEAAPAEVAPVVEPVQAEVEPVVAPVERTLHEKAAPVIEEKSYSDYGGCSGKAKKEAQATKL